MNSSQLIKCPYCNFNYHVEDLKDHLFLEHDFKKTSNEYLKERLSAVGFSDIIDKLENYK